MCVCVIQMPSHVSGAHLNCFKQFDGYGGEIAHKFIRDIHFDKTEPYVGEMPGSSSRTEFNQENAINLLLVRCFSLFLTHLMPPLL